jgi:hypothetical protein
LGLAAFFDLAFGFTRCCGGLFATTSAARSKRAHASGCSSTSLGGYVLPMKLTVNEEGVWFYYQLGLAITSWAHVEQSLYCVGSCCFNEDDQSQFVVTFFSIENFRSKLQVVDRLIKQNYKSHVKNWEPLALDLERLSKIRNHLAHYPVMNYGNDVPGKRIALLPRFGQPSKFKQATPKPPSGSIGLRDIVHARQRFVALAFGLEFFYDKLVGRLSHIPASAAQAKSAPSLEDIARQMRAILTPQHVRSSK